MGFWVNLELQLKITFYKALEPYFNYAKLKKNALGI
jgi:hypothetical protein